jgi:hypothetical protein
LHESQGKDYHFVIHFVGSALSMVPQEKSKLFGLLLTLKKPWEQLGWFGHLGGLTFYNDFFRKNLCNRICLTGHPEVFFKKFSLNTYFTKYYMGHNAAEYAGS